MERAVVRALIKRALRGRAIFSHIQPRAHEAHQLHVGISPCAGIVGVGHAVWTSHMVAA